MIALIEAVNSTPSYANDLDARKRLIYPLTDHIKVRFPHDFFLDNGIEFRSPPPKPKPGGGGGRRRGGGVGHGGGADGDARRRATVLATSEGNGQKAEAAPPTQSEPAELPPEQRLDDDEFAVCWALKDGGSYCATDKRLYSHDLDAPAVLARLKHRKLLRPCKKKMKLTALGQELLALNNTNAEADEDEEEPASS